MQTARPCLAEGGLAHAELKAHGACGVGEAKGAGMFGTDDGRGDGCHVVGVERCREARPVPYTVESCVPGTLAALRLPMIPRGAGRRLCTDGARGLTPGPPTFGFASGDDSD